MEEKIKKLINLKQENKIKKEILQFNDNIKKNRLEEYNSLQNKIKKIRSLLIYKNNLDIPEFSKINKYFYLNKKIKTSNIKKVKSRSNSNNKLKENSLSARKRNIKISLSLNNAQLKKIFNIKRKNETSHISIKSRNKNNIYQSKTVSITRNKENILNNIWYKNYNYKLFENINFFKNIKKNRFNFNKINITEKGLDLIDDENFKEYEKYYLRGLILSTEQNYYYKKCKNCDLIGDIKENLDIEQNKNNIGNKNNSINVNVNKKIFSDKKNLQKLRIKFINCSKYSTINNIQNKNIISFKYSLKDLIKTKNPIKIKINNLKLY